MLGGSFNIFHYRNIAQDTQYIALKYVALSVVVITTILCLMQGAQCLILKSKLAKFVGPIKTCEKGIQTTPLLYDEGCQKGNQTTPLHNDKGCVSVRPRQRPLSPGTAIDICRTGAQDA